MNKLIRSIICAIIGVSSANAATVTFTDSDLQIILTTTIDGASLTTTTADGVIYTSRIAVYRLVDRSGERAKVRCPGLFGDDHVDDAGIYCLVQYWIRRSRTEE